jgi:hypothetical protein
MATPLPPSTDFTGAAVTEGGAKTAYSSQRTFLADLLGTDGVILTAWNNLKQAATETLSGVVEKATKAEMEAQAADKYPDAAVLINHPGIDKAWAKFDFDSTPVITGSLNVSSITWSSAGIGSVNLSITMADATYAAIGSCNNSASGGRFPGASAYTTTSFGIIIRNSSGTAQDAADVCFNVKGDLA